MDNKQIKRIEKGIYQYQYLRQNLFAMDVSVNREFQRTFNGFFRMRQREAKYYIDFYCYLELHKRCGVSFADALAFFYERYGRIEMSFVSKMVALVNPEQPIWDSIVAGKHFGLQKPNSNVKNRYEKTIQKYNEYCAKYAAYIQTDEAKEKIKIFNKHFPNVNISDIKKVDFILWQDR